MAAVDEGLAIAGMYLRMTWRFRWVALAIALLVSCIGWLGVMLMPSTYQASTRVYLDTDSVLRPLLRGIAVDSGAQIRSVKLLTRTLLLRPNLEAVARKTDMDLKASTNQQFDALLEKMRKRVSVTSTRRSNIFVIRYNDADPKQAYRVVEALLNILVEKSLGESRKDTTTSKRFIDDQIKEYEARLVTAESRLKEFKRKNIGMMPSDGKSYFSRLEGMRARVRSASLELTEAQRRVEAISAQMKGIPAYVQGAAVTPTNSQVIGLTQRITRTERDLDEMLRKYTDKHPDVVILRDLVSDLRSELVSLQNVAQEPTNEQGGIVAGVPNPLYRELRVSLGESEAEVAAMSARVKEYQLREEQLRKLVDTIPRVEAELKRLNRDYAVDRKNYTNLVQRREQLRISNDATQTTDNVKFNVIEPPREPLRPVGPNRALLSASVLGASLAAGIGLAFLLGLIKPAFYTRSDFSDITKAPVLGVISRIWTPREKLQRRLNVITYAVGCLLLLAAFGGVMMIHTVYEEQFLDFGFASKVERMKDRFL
jgi:polysaccharide chain length determinant protein (PEP-CTERM system associated)